VEEEGQTQAEDGSEEEENDEDDGLTEEERRERQAVFEAELRIKIGNWCALLVEDPELNVSVPSVGLVFGYLPENFCATKHQHSVRSSVFFFSLNRWNT
jgi:hypothetical protein